MVQYIVIAYDDVLYHALVPQAVYRASQSLAQYRPVPVQYYGRIRLYARLNPCALPQGWPGPWPQALALGSWYIPRDAVYRCTRCAVSVHRHCTACTAVYSVTQHPEGCPRDMGSEPWAQGLRACTMV